MKPGPTTQSDLTTLETELLRLFVRQSRRMPAPVFVAALLLCWLGRSPPATQDSVLGAWLVLVAAALLARRLVLNSRAVAALPPSTGLQVGVAFSTLNGCIHALVLVVAPAPTDVNMATQSLLLVGLCAGAVATTAGYRPAFLGYMLPVIGALMLRWSSSDLAIAAIIGIFGAVLTSLADDSYRLFRDSFNIRLQQLALNERLREALRQAESANRAKTRFLASASHDLRQPIYTVSLFAASLSLHPLDPETREISQHIDEALQSLTDQLDALLDISKLDAGIVPVQLEVVAPVRFLQRMWREFNPVAQEKGLELTIEIGCPSAGTMLTDEVLLGRMVGNLIDNAIKYSVTGTIALSLFAQAGLLAMVIEDEGPGIPAEEHERVFEEFYQLENVERDRTKGLGLGLSIVYRLAALLHVRLEMVSSPGHGTVFYLLLPEHCGGACEVARTPYHGNPLAGLTVLVVDDEARVRKGMGMLLHRLGASAVMADGTAAALQALERVTPNLLLADLRLRGGDTGIATVQAVRARLPGLPAILISGDTSPERLREASDAQIPLLHKPAPVAQLQQLVAELVTPARKEDHVN